ncbi:MAG: hypothetical protein JOY72_04025 [Actinobacteria bacterium]|nr:hypothetical protein [Actinomycetota bacterium]MBV8479451.1 hypothetical protein [Actinomycetota bacterium]
MRRLIFIGLGLGALALPAAALALHQAAGDGTLVVKSGSAPASVAVIHLVINGTAIGHVSSGSPDQPDTVVIDDPNQTGDIGASATNNAPYLTRKQVSDTETKFVGSDFRFRAAAGVYQIWIYGSGVDLFAVGKGNVVLQGQSDQTVPDGKYAFNGGTWHSLPPTPTDLLPIAAGSSN